MTRGKAQPPKQLMNAVAMESANRAYVQQTLNRLKDIAIGQAPELPNESPSEEKGKLKKAAPKKSASAKKTADKALSAVARTSPKAKKPTGTTKKAASSTPSPEEDKTSTK